MAGTFIEFVTALCNEFVRHEPEDEDSEIRRNYDRSARDENEGSTSRFGPHNCPNPFQPPAREGYIKMIHCKNTVLFKSLSVAKIILVVEAMHLRIKSLVQTIETLPLIYRR